MILTVHSNTVTKVRVLVLLKLREKLVNVIFKLFSEFRLSVIFKWCQLAVKLKLKIPVKPVHNVLGAAYHQCNASVGQYVSSMD